MNDTDTKNDVPKMRLDQPGYFVDEEYLGEDKDRIYSVKHFETLADAASYANAEFKKQSDILKSQYEVTISSLNHDGESVEHVAELSEDALHECLYALSSTPPFSYMPNNAYINITNHMKKSGLPPLNESLVFDPEKNVLKVFFVHHDMFGNTNNNLYSFSVSPDYKNVTFDKEEVIRLFRNEWQDIYDVNQKRCIEMAFSKQNTEEIIFLMNPKFSSAEMDEIRFGLNDGFTLDIVKCYARENMTSSEMASYRDGLNLGIPNERIEKILSNKGDDKYVDIRRTLDDYSKQVSYTPENMELCLVSDGDIEM